MSGTAQAFRGGRLAATGARLVVALLVVSVMFLPIYISVISAFTTNGAIARDGLVPGWSEVTLENFRTAVTAVPLLQQYAVSVAVVILQTLGQVVTGALAAYALVFPNWRGRNTAFVFVLATLALPGESLLIPNYELVSQLGLRDTVLGVVLPYLTAGYVIFLLRQAFAAVPVEIWEAARLDGASHLRTLFAIVMPACRTQMATAVVWAGLGAWNGFFWPLLITDTAAARTVQVGISQLAASESSDPSVIFAGAILVVLPTVVLVIAAQRFLINSLAREVLR